MISPGHLWLLASFVFAFTFVVPVINLLIFRYLGSVRSLQMETRQERVMPFIFISSLYVLVVYLFFYRLPFSANFNKLMMIVALLVLTSTVITFFTKVSVHSLSTAGMIGILLPLIRFAPALLWPTSAIIIIGGVVISSRLLLNAHTPRETLVGSIAGLAVGYGGMVIFF